MLTLSSHMVFLSQCVTGDGGGGRNEHTSTLFLQKHPRTVHREVKLTVGPWQPVVCPHSGSFFPSSLKGHILLGVLSQAQLWALWSSCGHFLLLVSWLRPEPKQQTDKVEFAKEGKTKKINVPVPTGLTCSFSPRPVRVTVGAHGLLFSSKVEACGSKSSMIMWPGEMVPSDVHRSIIHENQKVKIQMSSWWMDK